MSMPRVNGRELTFGEAIRQAYHRYVTIGLREVEFRRPVLVGDVLGLYTETTRIGRTSVTVQVRVRSRRRSNPDDLIDVTQAEVVLVAVDEDGSPVPVFAD